MAHAVQCDRCKKFETFKFFAQTLPPDWRSMGMKDADGTFVFLCGDCATEFDAFMRGEETYEVRPAK